MVHSLLKQWKITKRYDQHHRRLVHDAITRHHPPIPAPSRVEVLRATHHMYYLETRIIARLSILILSKTYPTKDTSRHVGLLAVGFILPKSN
jgi:hypothetical protein